MRSRFALLIVILVLPLTVLVITRSKPTGAYVQDDAFNISVKNKTRETQVIKAKNNNGQLTVALKNDYNQRITAFVISVGNFSVTEDFAYSEVPDEFGIKPQETFEKTYSLPTSFQYDYSLGVTVQAIVLEDKTGDGDPHTFEEIKDERLGEAIQIRRSLKLMERYLQSPSGRTGMNVGNLKTNLSAALDGAEPDSIAVLKELQPLGSLSQKEGELLSDQIKSGLNHGKTNALRKIEEVENSATPREALLAIRDRYERLLTRL